MAKGKHPGSFDSKVYRSSICDGEPVVNVESLLFSIGQQQLVTMERNSMDVHILRYKFIVIHP